MSLLVLDQLSKSYGGIPALKAASLELERGEVHGLMGENGAGKSTLIRLLAGIVRADSGRILIEGKEAAIATPADALALGLRFIHQELNIVPQLSVAENIFLGRPYPRRAGWLVDWGALNARAGQALANLGIDHLDPRQKMARLSVGDRMLVKIASAFLTENGQPARLYVMDEPTAALTAAESEKLFAVMDRLRREGCGILYVSHRMDEVMRLCDRITVMRDGEIKASLERAENSQSEIIELMIGRSLAQNIPPRRQPVGADVAMAVDDMTSSTVSGISFTLKRGEILGLAGLAGSGQSDVLRLLMGAETGQGQPIRIDGRTMAYAEPADAWAGGFGYVPAERRQQGLILDRSVSDNATLPHLKSLSRAGLFLNRSRERARSRELASEVRLKSQGPAQKVRQLSGGNQQKVVFARAMAASPRVLILDEPTRGVDVGARHDIYGLIRDLTDRGTTVVLASSDLAELIGLCDRLAIMRDGRISEIVDTAGLTEQTLLALCYDAQKTGTQPN